MAGIGIVRQREGSANDEANDAKEIHCKPLIVDFSGMIARQVEIRRRPQTNDDPHEEECKKNTVSRIVMWTELVVESEGNGEEAQRSEQVTVYIDGLVMKVAETGYGFPVAVGDWPIMAEDVLIILLPWFQVVPAPEKADIAGDVLESSTRPIRQSHQSL